MQELSKKPKQLLFDIMHHTFILYPSIIRLFLKSSKYNLIELHYITSTFKNSKNRIDFSLALEFFKYHFPINIKKIKISNVMQELYIILSQKAIQ